jgi:hypothetical protein
MPQSGIQHRNKLLRQDRVSTTRCPKCKLINRDTVGHCRRCNTPLAVNSKSPQLNRAVWLAAIPVIVIVLALGRSAFYRYSPDASAPLPGLAESSRVVGKAASANQEMDKVKRLSRELIAGLDQNMANRNGDGLKKNQTLAFNTMKQLKEQQDILTNPAALRYLNEFGRLVETYYDQIIQYNSEISHFEEVRQRSRSSRQRILKDSSLSPEEKSAKQLELWEENAGEEKLSGALSSKMDETVKSLRNMVSG